jgi:hypothetical protein
MSELKTHPVTSGDDAETRHAVNGMPARARHRVRWRLGAESNDGETPRDRTARLRVLAGSAIGVACLFVANGLAPAQGSLFAVPSGAVAWLAIICGIVGIWLVPGLWLSAVMMRFGVGPAAWLGTRIATTLAWYALVGPVIHRSAEGASVTTVGILTVTMAATAAVSLGVALGLMRRPAGRWPRILIAAIVGAAGTQGAIWASSLKWSDDRAYSHFRLDSLIVLGCALLVVVGALSRPKLPPIPTARNIRTPVIALAVIAVTATALLALGARWSPAQQMPSAFSVEQVAAPAGADIAFTLAAIGPEGAELIRRANFTVSDDTGRPVSVITQFEPASGTGVRVTLLVVLERSSQPMLCGEGRMEKAIQAGAPLKITMRDQVSGLLTQADVPIGWCAG